MTLYRQLAVSIVLLFALGFLGTVLISTNNLRDFLSEQWGSHAQDTATSLGLSLSPPMQSGDLTTVRSMVDAIFDRGYYKSISVVSVDGKTVIERMNPVNIRNVPDWFIELIKLEPPAANAMVMDGWRQAGHVHVMSHPGHAYNELWSNTTDTFRMFSISAITILLLGLLILWFLLRPLRRVEMQAEAICNRSYPVQRRLPLTRELRRVVQAMNRLSARVKAIFMEQAELAERLREQAYKDPVSNLGNRRYFNRQLQNLVDPRTESTQGAVLLIELHQLERINQQAGFTAGDQLIRGAGKLIQAHMEKLENCFIARISGATFGVIMADIGPEEIDAIADELNLDLLQLHADGLAELEHIANIGIAMWQQGDSLTDILSEADISLRAAQAKGENSWQRFNPPAGKQTVVHGAGHWQVFLRKAINSGDAVLFYQPVFERREGHKTLLHREILLRLPDDAGNTLQAGVFIPMAERTGLGTAIDKLTIGRVIEYFKGVPLDPSPLAINLTSSSVHDPVFHDWLSSILQENSEYASRLAFEIPEYAVMRNLRTASAFIESLAGTGAQCGIDHFGRGFNSFGYLRSLKVEYLKIDGSHIRGIDTELDNQFLIGALTRTAHSVEIKVIAEMVETREERKAVESLQVDGIQGYLTGAPEAL